MKNFAKFIKFNRTLNGCAASHCVFFRQLVGLIARQSNDGKREHREAHLTNRRINYKISILIIYASTQNAWMSMLHRCKNHVWACCGRAMHLEKIISSSCEPITTLRTFFRSKFLHLHPASTQKYMALTHKPVELTDVIRRTVRNNFGSNSFLQFVS